MTDPRLAPGDVIEVCEALVRRTVAEDYGIPEYDCVVYRCDRTPIRVQGWALGWFWKVSLLPARYCPAWAVRTRLEVVSVQPELLSAITDDDARREGIARMGHEPTAATFVRVFRELHELAADADPVVFRIEFRRLEVARG